MNKFIFPAFVVAAFLFSSCGSYFNQPVVQQEARIGEITSMSDDLETLPAPLEPVVVGVYNFRDQTGQYKPSDIGSSFSTAVTQGATSILIKALEDSNWFVPIERESLNNLLNERNIIRSTRQEYRNPNDPNQTVLPPLLYAGVLLEGGIISYDTNILTGGMGARYFGVGGSTQYRQDRITVYLRAISTSSGKILKTVYVSKTILSQAIDASLFRYVNFQRLLEVETGYTKNEPVQLAVKEAIEKAVEALVIEGIEEDLWRTKDQQEGKDVVVNYNLEKEEEELTKLYDREIIIDDHKNSFNLSIGANRLMGDYSERKPGYLIRAGYQRELSPWLGLSFDGSLLELKSGSENQISYASADVNLYYNVLPYDKLGPFLYAGPGVLMNIDGEDEPVGDASFLKFQYGAGLLYTMSNSIDLKIFAEHNLPFSDELDFLTNGRLEDYYFNFGLGVNIKFGGSNNEGKIITAEEN